MVTKKDLAEVLRTELSGGSLIHVHSSLSSFGYMDGGAEAVISALEEAAAPGGTLSMPALCQKDKERRFETWDITNSPSDVGRITEVFRLQPNTMRSDHPTHSVCARGSLASELTQGHRTGKQRQGPWGGYAFGHNSPWQKLYGFDATVILLGTDMKTSTLIHFVEHIIAEDAVLNNPREKAEILKERLSGWNKPGIWPRYDPMALQSQMEERGLLKYVLCGKCQIILYKTRDMVDLAFEIMRKEPKKWFSPEFAEWL